MREPDARRSARRGNTIARHHGAELVAGRIPADVPAFEGTATLAPRPRPSTRPSGGKPRANHADVDIEIERKPLRCCSAATSG